MKSFLLLSFLFFSIIIGYGQEVWENFSGGNQFYDATISNGYLWIGTEGGLIRYNIDSKEKEVFKASNSPFKGTGVSSVESGVDGDVWIGGGNGGLFRIKDGNWDWHYYSDQGDTLLAIRNLRVASNGDVWFVTNVNSNCGGCKKLFRYNGNTIENLTSKVPQTASGFAEGDDLEVTSDNMLWIASRRRVSLFDGSEILQSFDKTNAPFDPDEKIRFIGVDEMDRLWIALYKNSSVVDRVGRFLIYDNGGWQDIAVPDSTYCTNIVEAESGELWFSFYKVSTQEAFVGQHINSNWQLLDTSDYSTVHPFPADPRLQFVDENDIPWFSVYEDFKTDLVTLFGDNYEQFEVQMDPIDGHHHGGIGLDCQGNLWLLSFPGILNVYDGETWNPPNLDAIRTYFFGSPRLMATNPVTCDVWILDGAENSGFPGLVKFDGNEYATFDITNDHSYFDLEFDSEGNTWVATGTGGVGRYSDGNWTWFNQQNSPLTTNATVHIQIDSKDRVWIATWNDGLFRFDGDEWVNWTNQNSPVPNRPFNIYIDEKDLLWTSTTTLGNYTFDSQNWQPVTIPGLENGFGSVAEDGLGNYWFSTALGVVHWDGNNTTHYSVVNSDIGANYIYDVLIDPLGYKYFGYHEGVTIYRDTQGIKKERLFGSVFFDMNKDGEFQEYPEVGVYGHKVKLYPSEHHAFTNGQGQFVFFVDPEIDHQIEYDTASGWALTTPQVHEVMDIMSDQVRFGVFKDDLPDDISIDVVPGQSVCSENMVTSITIRNLGIQPLAGVVNYIGDSSLTIINTFPTADFIQSQEIQWKFDSLRYNETYTFSVIHLVPGVDFVGEILEFFASVVIADELVRTDESTSLVFCSYDPNDKRSKAKGPSVNEYYLQDKPIDYTIRFQNYGNYRAKNVIIRDTLDPQLDPSTLKVLVSSHDMTTTIDQGGIIEFRFDNIFLPPEQENRLGSQGYVRYRISPHEGLPDPTIIQNTAHIYFDLNPAVVTNTTENILVESLPISDGGGGSLESSARFYPNPGRDEVTFEFSTPTSMDGMILIYSIEGKEVIWTRFEIEEQQIPLDIIGLEPGVYAPVIQFSDGHQIHLNKLVKL